MNQLSSMQYLDGLETDAESTQGEKKDPAVVAAQTLIPPSDKQRITIAAICILLGFLGAGSVAWKGYSLTVNNTEEFRKQAVKKMKTSRERKVYRKIQEIHDKYKTFTLFEIIAHGMVTGALVFGGMYSFANRRTSAGFLATVCTAAIVYLIVRLLWNAWVGFETYGVVQEAFAKGKHGDTVASVMQFGLIFGLVISALIASVFIGFYVYAISVLRKFQDFVDAQLALYQSEQQGSVVA